MTARGCREWRHMGVETGVAHDFMVHIAEMGVALSGFWYSQVHVPDITLVFLMYFF